MHKKTGIPAKWHGTKRLHMVKKKPDGGSMGLRRWKWNIGVFLYDRQKSGKYFAALKKSFSEVNSFLKNKN